MIFYFAGVPGGSLAGWYKREAELVPMWTHRLWTYYWIIEHRGVMEKPDCIEMFLDSGAFSAWSKGAQIRIRDYIAFIKRHQQYIDHYANLDVIADTFKKRGAASALYRKAAEATLHNQQVM